MKIRHLHAWHRTCFTGCVLAQVSQSPADWLPIQADSNQESTMTTLIRTLAAAAAIAALAPATAATVVGGYTFDDNAFADTLISSSGAFTTAGGSLVSVLTDTDAGTYAFSRDLGAYVELGFTDNTLVNGTGADLVLFELGVPSIFKLSLTINGITRSYASAFTGSTAGGFNLNAAAIDLDDFGMPVGASLGSIVIGMDDDSNTAPSLSLVGALNSGRPGSQVPTPGTLALAGLALLGLGATARRRAA